MTTSYRPYAPDQALLLPASLREWLPEGHLVYFISDAVDALDLSAFYARYEGDGRRRQPYEPTLLVKVLIYAYASGVFSSRKIAQRLEEDVAFRVLAAGNFPAHRTLREFRRLHPAEFSALFLQVVQLAREAGLVKLGRIGIDGTKVKANASRHKAMSYGRMGEREQQLKAEIAALTRQAEVQDAAEDRRYGKDRRGDELPAELARRESRLQVIQAAKARLEARQCARDKEAGRHVDDEGHTRGPGGRRCKRALGEVPDTVQDNFTDPEARIMKTAHGFDPCYNAQAAVDEDSHLIVATELGNGANDVRQLVPMVQAVQHNVDALPMMTLADAGYASEANF
ncbi:MAG TPA: IS1182 family transposase, partial [Nevskiaceae bacterium]|nr:IS1182 family transposase [Nevskiaceae bacterium]